MERQNATSRYHGSKIFGTQQSFLTEKAICTVEQWKKRLGHRKVIYNIFFFVFFAIFEGPRFLESQDFFLYSQLNRRREE